ncbi:MAG TPA: hypothetical protein VN736_06695 [Candidatus Limnocylindrales bacterium]|jgi:hypothetical protein|nr:hypothetical protein [Candidatus Limnocylindrales bacterium]
MSLPPDLTMEDFRNLVETLQRAISEMSSLAERIDALEKANAASYEAAVALKDSQQQLYEAQRAQQEVNRLMKQSLDDLLVVMGRKTTVH